jgi:NTE family protein
MRTAAGPRIGLVLGAGGVLGGAWMTGALHAIASETGWDPGSAEFIVGTSAGSMVGALLACGVPPWFMCAHSAGEAFPGLHDARGELASSADRAAGASYRLHRGMPALGPGSWRLAVSSLTRPHRYSPAAILAAWLPLGPLSTEPLKDTVRRICGEPWAPHPNYWSMTIDYRTGRRVALGRAGAPAAELPDAVAASCAIPGFYRAVEIGGRRYIDGGLSSASNLDVLEDEGLDLVIALNPMSSLHPVAPRALPGRVAFAMRQGAGRRLGSEAKRLRAMGTEVALLQPMADDLEVMGTNLMNRDRRNDVIETALETVTGQLRGSELGARLSELPRGLGELVRRPRRSARSWPGFTALAEARWSASPAEALAV